MVLGFYMNDFDVLDVFYIHISSCVLCKFYLCNDHYIDNENYCGHSIYF